ncbi:plasmid partitioning/stability family protein [Pseudomonas aeruginosa]|uniref:plasmid partitioning/stability family protein n=1 Tax=Pseudomonas aeruginosa TaxID=287 RepID=UPI003F5B5442
MTEASSRLRGDLLRNLIITGLALHTTAPELPRLLARRRYRPPRSVSCNITGSADGRHR